LFGVRSRSEIGSAGRLCRHGAQRPANAQKASIGLYMMRLPAKKTLDQLIRGVNAHGSSSGVSAAHEAMPVLS
jgi:hypothetical protein